MIPFDLRRWFRPRMLPIVSAAALVVFVAAPLSYHLARRRELVRETRSAAARVAAVLQGEIEQRPLLWRYDMPKLTERLAEVGLLDVPAIVIRDREGVDVPVDLGPPRPPGPRLWGRAEVLGQATVWVAADAEPLWHATLWLGAAFALLAALLGAVLYLLPMRAIATAQRRIAALMGELALTLQEEDRRRIARDLHDGAGQALTAARLQLLALARGRGEPDERAAPLAELGHLLDEAMAEVRRSAYALAPPALAELGLGGALARHCEAFAAATGLEVHCEVDPGLGPLPAAVETACYRIVQEALSNSARHAGARRAWVQLRRDAEGLRLCVYDDGTARRGAGEGLGLHGIRERARLLGGAAIIMANEMANEGLRVEVQIPLEEGIT